VSIKLKLDPTDAASLRAGLAPVHEALLSLHVLLHPWYHPLQHPWVRAMRSLSPALKRDVRTFAFLYHDATPDCFIPVGGDDEATFEAGLTSAARLPIDNLRFALARPLFFYGSEPGVTVDDARERIRTNAARYGESTSAVVELLLDEPDEFVHRLLKFLQAYWEETFAATWSEVEPLLRAEVDRARRSFAGGEVFALLEPFKNEVKVDRATGILERRSPHEHTVAPTAERPVHFYPSVYIWPHVRVNCDEPWPLAVAYPAEFVALEARRAAAPSELAAALRAAGDPTRLEILRLVSRQPRTTEELAALVGLSSSGLSKHLKALTEAALVTSRRDGWYVLYSAERDRLAALSGDLLGYIDA
jgi:DNA-binding transcriptional ArsR family regulator